MRRISLVRAEDGSASPLATSVSLFSTRDRLVVRFRSEAAELTSHGSHHDDDLWIGDVVELFIAPNASNRQRYFEIEVNPAGLAFDAVVDSPDLDRRTMRVDRSWNPATLRVRSRVLRTAGKRSVSWLVRLSVAWSDFGIGSRDAIAFNAYRIDRRSTPSPEYLAVRPPHRRPADFHVPESFVPWRPVDGCFFKSIESL